MSSTEKRVEDLLDRWLASVELHARYLQLDDAAYARAEAWPKHQRPNALVINLARTRLLDLKTHLSERRDAGDTRFAESLELMSFLTSLLGAEHIERFIPLATGKPADTGISATVEQPRIKPASSPPRKPARVVTPQAAQSQLAKSAPPSNPPRHAAQRQSASPPASPSPGVPPATIGEAMTRQVVADAIRMLEWGREWPAIAGLIARMADRPSEADVWKILRAHRTEIQGKGRRGIG